MNFFLKNLRPWAWNTLHGYVAFHLGKQTRISWDKLQTETRIKKYRYTFESKKKRRDRKVLNPGLDLTPTYAERFRRIFRLRRQPHTSRDLADVWKTADILSHSFRFYLYGIKMSWVRWMILSRIFSCWISLRVVLHKNFKDVYRMIFFFFFVRSGKSFWSIWGSLTLQNHRSCGVITRGGRLSWLWWSRFPLRRALRIPPSSWCKRHLSRDTLSASHHPQKKKETFLLFFKFWPSPQTHSSNKLLRFPIVIAIHAESLNFGHEPAWDLKSGFSVIPPLNAIPKTISDPLSDASKCARKRGTQQRGDVQGKGNFYVGVYILVITVHTDYR